MSKARTRSGGVVLAIVLVVAFASATSVIGWWTVPVLALLYGAVARDVRRRGLVAAVAAVAAWTIVLIWIALHGARVSATASTIGSVMGMRAAVLVGFTLIFAALLAGPAALLGSVVSRGAMRR